MNSRLSHLQCLRRHIWPGCRPYQEILTQKEQIHWVRLAAGLWDKTHTHSCHISPAGGFIGIKHKLRGCRGRTNEEVRDDCMWRILRDVKEGFWKHIEKDPETPAEKRLPYARIRADDCWTNSWRQELPFCVLRFLCKVHLDCLNFLNTKAKQSVGWMLQGDKEMRHDELCSLSFVCVWKHLRITPLQRADIFKACLNISTTAQVGGGAGITRDVKVSEPQRTEQQSSPPVFVNM